MIFLAQLMVNSSRVCIYNRLGGCSKKRKSVVNFLASLLMHYFFWETKEQYCAFFVWAIWTFCRRKILLDLSDLIFTDSVKLNLIDEAVLNMERNWAKYFVVSGKRFFCEMILVLKGSRCVLMHSFYVLS